MQNFWISLSPISGSKILSLSFEFEKLLLFQFLRLLHFQITVSHGSAYTLL